MLKMTSISIYESSEAQRKLFATNFLGLDIEPEETDETITAKILSANGGSELIFIAEDAPGTDQVGQAPPMVAGAREAPVGQMQGSLGRDDPKVEIFINNEDRNGEVYSADVAVGVNGIVWQLKRGQTLTIPYRVYEALNNAVRDSITHDPNTHNEMHAQVRAVAFNVASMPPRDEVLAYRERTDAAFCP